MKNDEEVSVADELANYFLKICAEFNCPFNVAQAALGSAWMKVLYAMDISPSEFREMSKELLSVYEKFYELTLLPKENSEELKTRGT